jgi:outer membrane lipoprotein carrier protein
MERLPLFLIITFTIAIPIRAENKLNEVQEKFMSITSFAASFAQTTIPPMGDTQHFEGKIALSRPAKVRMEISSPEKQLIVYNGEHAWLYLPVQRICYIYSAESIGNLAQMPEYIFDPFEKLTVDTFFTTDTFLVIEFTAPETDPLIESIDLTISSNTLIPHKLLIEDKAGTKIEYAFSAITINGTEQVSFTFTPPESTEVIEQ